MNNILKHIKLILFLLTGLCIVSFITQDPISTPARFQYNHITTLRQLADLLCLFSISFLTYRQWKPMGIDKYFIFSWYLFFAISILDLHVWLWWTSASSLYAIIILIHSLPMPILIHQILSSKQLKAKTFFITGFVIFILGILYDIVFISIPSQDITAELFEKSIRQETTRNWFYYTGVIIILSGLVKLISQKRTSTDLTND